MKKQFLVTLFAPVMFSFAVNAQQQFPLGRFIVGTSPVFFSYEGQKNITQSSNSGYVQSDTAHFVTTAIHMHINLFAGYFVTKNICAGLQFSANSTHTYSTFIRYYFGHKRPDSARVDFFIQANGTIGYSSTDHPAVTNYYPSTSEYYNISTTGYTTDETDLGIGVGFAAAFHLTRHWAFETEIGYVGSGTVQNAGSYTTTTIYNPGYPYNPPASVSVTPGLKSVSHTNEAVLKIMLSYRL